MVVGSRSNEIRFQLGTLEFKEKIKIFLFSAPFDLDPMGIIVLTVRMCHNNKSKSSILHPALNVYPSCQISNLEPNSKSIKVQGHMGLIKTNTK